MQWSYRFGRTARSTLSSADPTLLTVRGFDAASNQFVYTVNPQFGGSAQYRNTFRAPFRAHVDARVEIGPDRETQYLSSILRPRANEPGELNEQQIKARISRGFNPMDQFLVMKDSLKLSQAQVDSSDREAQSRGARRATRLPPTLHVT